MNFNSSRPAIGVLSLLIAVAVPAATNHNPQGTGFPAHLDQLPPGRLKSQIDKLPPAAQQRAIDWLQRFSFPTQDLDYLQADPEGGIFYSDTELPEPVTASSDATASTAQMTLPEEAFMLHSRPGASKVVFLDFDGDVISGTAWNSGGNTLYAKPYDTDGNPTGFSDSERHDIAEIWHRVSEDLAPFDIDVTTEDPGSFGPTIGHVLITDSTDETGAAMPSQSAGGVAYVGVWGASYYTNYQPALVYADHLGPNFPPFIAEASSHEFGHNLGLSHDGTSTQSYYAGLGSGYVSWAPIMGVGYYNNVTEWSDGEYPDANNPEDDVAIIAGELGLRPDDHGNTPATATPLQVDPDGTIYVTFPEIDPDNLSPANKGVIETRNDIDVFSFDTAAGPVTLKVLPAWEAFTRSSRRGANLDIQATLYDALGNPVASSDPLDDTMAQIDATLAAGRYYLAVTGVGNAVTPYSDYGSLGMYFISGNVQPVATDTTAPNPNPMSWSSVPAAMGSNQIDMIATTATDDSGVVEYWFQCTAGGSGCGSSGWQTDTHYSATGLSAGTSYSFQVKARDAAGNETGWSGMNSAMTAANQAPIATDDTASTAENKSVSVAVLANDSDPDGDTLSIGSFGQGTHGSVTLNGSQLVYQPASGFSGSDSFSYTVIDGNGGSATAAVSVTVTAVNQAPIAQDDSASVVQNGSVTIDVLANDSDPDGDALSIVGYTQGGKGSVVQNGSQLIYTSSGKRGGDSFTYTISDGDLSATATVSISIGSGSGGGSTGGGSKCNPKHGC